MDTRADVARRQTVGQKVKAPSVLVGGKDNGPHWKSVFQARLADAAGGLLVGDKRPSETQARGSKPRKPVVPQARSVADLLRAIVWYADPVTGQARASLRTLARRARMDLRTARRALAVLNRDSLFLRAQPMTWAQLTAICRAAGRYLPDRDDLGQAPYLITVLDGEGKPAIELGAALRRPGKANADPKDNAKHGSGEQRRDRAPKDQGEAQPWMDGFAALNEAHATKSASKAHGVRPPPAKLSREDREAMGECVAATAGTLAAKIYAETGATLERKVALEQLAARVIKKFFANPGKNDHLEKTKHKLEDLRIELFQHAVNSMDELLREHLYAHRDAAEAQRRRAPLLPTFARHARDAAAGELGEPVRLRGQMADGYELGDAAAGETSVDQLGDVEPDAAAGETSVDQRAEIDAALLEFWTMRENTPQTPQRKPTLYERQQELRRQAELVALEEEAAERARRPALQTPPGPSAEEEQPPGGPGPFWPIGPPGAPRWGTTRRRPVRRHEVRPPEPDPEPDP